MSKECDHEDFYYYPSLIYEKETDEWCCYKCDKCWITKEVNYNS